MFEKKRQGRGLSAYAKVSRFRPFLSGITLTEGLLSLMGLSVLLLWLMSGSFTQAGQAIDLAIFTIIKALPSFG